MSIELHHPAASPSAWQAGGVLYLAAPLDLQALGALRAHRGDAAEADALLVYFALRRHHGGLTPAEAGAIAGAATPGELATLGAIAVPDDPDPWPDDGGDAGGPGRGLPTWGRIFEDVATLRPGWTYRDIAALTLDQLRIVQRGGKSAGERPIAHEEAARRAAGARERAKAEGTYREPPPPGGVPWVMPGEDDGAEAAPGHAEDPAVLAAIAAFEAARAEMSEGAGDGA